MLNVFTIFLVESTMKTIVMKLENISSVEREEYFMSLDMLKKAYVNRKNVFQIPIVA